MMFRLIFTLSAFLALFPLSASEIRILFSTSLNGNLDGCGCHTHPVSGLVKRGVFIESYRRKHPEVILVDTGDLIVDARDIRKAKAVYSAYRLLKYDAVLPGDQDLILGVSSLQKLAGGLPLVSSNLFLTSGFLIRSKKNPFLIDRLLVRRGKKVMILGILQKEAFRFFPESKKRGLQIDDPAATLSKARGSDLLVILSHGGIDADRRLARNIKRPALLIGGHDQNRFGDHAGKMWRSDLWYFQSGRDGHALGEIVVELLPGGRYRILSERLIEFSHERDPDHPAIRKMIQDLKKGR